MNQCEQCVCSGNDRGVMFSLERQIHENTLWLPGMCSFFFHEFFFFVCFPFFKKMWHISYMTGSCINQAMCFFCFFLQPCLEKVKTKQNLSGWWYLFTLVNVICESLSKCDFGRVVLSEWNWMRLSHHYHELLLFLRPWLISHPGVMSTLTT